MKAEPVNYLKSMPGSIPFRKEVDTIHFYRVQFPIFNIKKGGNMSASAIGSSHQAVMGLFLRRIRPGIS